MDAETIRGTGRGAAARRTQQKPRVRYPQANAVLQRNVAAIAAAPQPPVEALAYRFITPVSPARPPAGATSRPSPSLIALLETAEPRDRGPTGAATAPVDGPEALGRQVRFARQGLNWAQHRLADEAVVGRRFVSELEAGKPTAELGKVFAVLRALGLTLFMGPEPHG